MNKHTIEIITHSDVMPKIGPSGEKFTWTVIHDHNEAFSHIVACVLSAT